MKSKKLTAAGMLLVAGGVLAVSQDPSAGLCDGLDPAGHLFPVCIQAHSERNRLEHLTATNASERAKAVAQRHLDDSIALFAALPGGGVIPGFEPQGEVFMNLPLVSEWTDLEVMAGEIPADPWGSCEEDMAARAALVVEFADGTSGAVLYSDLSDKWNRGFPNHAADFADGFFDSSCRFTLHGIGQALTVPMAWESCSMKYASNFDLDYTSRNGSHFRATTFGWDQATFRHYCGD